MLARLLSNAGEVPNEAPRVASDRNRHAGRANRSRTADGDPNNRLAQQPLARPCGAVFSRVPSGIAGETGYVEGHNVTVEYRWAEGNYDRLPKLAVELVGRRVDVIATSGGDPSALAAKKATSTIPIVSVVGADPVTDGLVGSFARPGGNLTGFSILNVELTPKRLELLCELIPDAKVIAFLVNPNSPQTEPVIQDMQEAARAKGVSLPVLNARNEVEIDAAFTSLTRLQANGLVVQ